MQLKIFLPLAALVATTLSTPLLRAGILEDRAIEDAIEGSYVFRTVLTDRSMVQVYVRRGEVELRGQAADERERALLEYTIAGIPNVERVDSHLFVDSAARRDTGRWRAARILAWLHTQADVDSSTTRLSARDGAFQLSGSVVNPAQRERIESHVRQLAPGDLLKNELQVDPARSRLPAVDDASIVAMVRCALDALPAEKDPSRRITSRNGEVVILGTAATAADLDSVTRCAETVRGVRAVRNQLTLRG